MLVIYLAVIAVGFGVFLFIFLQELKKESRARSLSSGDLGAAFSAPETVAKAAPPSPRKSFALFGRKDKPLAKPVVVEKPPAPPQEPLKNNQQELLDKAEQKCAKFEQLLEEKNQALDRLQKDLESERSHRGEFEALKVILQQQIDDLKLQNRNLKDELEKVLHDSLRLQAGTPAVSVNAALSPVPQPVQEAPVLPDPVALDFVRAEPEDEIIPASFNKPLILGEDKSKKDKVRSDSGKEGVSLHDVFIDGEKDSKPVSDGS